MTVFLLSTASNRVSQPAVGPQAGLTMVSLGPKFESEQSFVCSSELTSVSFVAFLPDRV